jgi:UMF1 family MFS transporter
MRSGNKREIFSWCLYDFANSTYSAVIAAVVFPVYYTTYIVGNKGGLGDLWWGRAISLSMLAVALSAPLLGGLADFTGRRKRFLLGFTMLSVISVASLSLLQKGMVITGFAFMVCANYGMEGAMVFYNSYLPIIADRHYQGRVSSWGFGLGYSGSILSLLVALPLVRTGHYGATWLTVAVMFALFSLPAFLFLPHDTKSASLAAGAFRGFSFTINTVRRLARDRQALRFLIAYLLYADGVNTVIVFSSVFAATTLGFSTTELIALYLMVQATALAGAFAMARAVDTRGPKVVVNGALMLWVLVCVLAFFVTTKAFFWGIAICAGLGLGTVQAASRAFYAQFIPEGHESEYFGVYSLAGKTSSVIGPILFGTVSSVMRSQRPAILSVAGFFVAGLVLLLFVKGGGPNVAPVRSEAGD